MFYRTALGLLGATALIVGLASRADAAVILTLAPDGQGNIVANGSGTLNTSALTMTRFGGPFVALIWPTPIFGATIFNGATVNFALQSNQILAGPSTYGPGGRIFATSGIGDMFGLTSGSLVVPDGYVSGSPLSNRALYSAATLASLGLTPGTYNYTWGSGGSADSFSIVISTTPVTSSVPEPGILPLLAMGGVMLLLRRSLARKTNKYTIPWWMSPSLRTSSSGPSNRTA